MQIMSAAVATLTSLNLSGKFRNASRRVFSLKLKGETSTLLVTAARAADSN